MEIFFVNSFDYISYVRGFLLSSSGVQMFEKGNDRLTSLEDCTFFVQG